MGRRTRSNSHQSSDSMGGVTSTTCGSSETLLTQQSSHSNNSNDSKSPKGKSADPTGTTSPNRTTKTNQRDSRDDGNRGITATFEGKKLVIVTTALPVWGDSDEDSTNSNTSTPTAIPRAMVIPPSHPSHSSQQQPKRKQQQPSKHISSMVQRIWELFVGKTNKETPNAQNIPSVKNNKNKNNDSDERETLHQIFRSKNGKTRGRLSRESFEKLVNTVILWCLVTSLIHMYTDGNHWFWYKVGVQKELILDHWRRHQATVLPAWFAKSYGSGTKRRRLLDPKFVGTIQIETDGVLTTFHLDQRAEDAFVALNDRSTFRTYLPPVPLITLDDSEFRFVMGLEGDTKDCDHPSLADREFLLCYNPIHLDVHDEWNWLYEQYLVDEEIPPDHAPKKRKRHRKGTLAGTPIFEEHPDLVRHTVGDTYRKDQRRDEDYQLVRRALDGVTDKRTEGTCFAKTISELRQHYFVHGADNDFGSNFERTHRLSGSPYERHRYLSLW